MTEHRKVGWWNAGGWQGLAIQVGGSVFFWLAWVLASVVAAWVGTDVGRRVYEITYSLGGWYLGMLVGAVVVGPTIGILQWVVLRRYISGGGWWMVTNSVGYPVAMVCSIIGAEMGDTVYNNGKLGVLAGCGRIGSDRANG